MRPEWFDRAVSEGIAQLIVLRQRGVPPEDIVAFTEEVWREAIWGGQASWDRDADAWRIKAGFLILSRTMDRWPAPKNLLDAMPPRRETRRLAPLPLTTEQMERNRRRIRDLVSRFVKRAKGEQQ